MQERTRNKKIRRGDTVRVIAGNSRGQKATVIAVNGDRVVLEGVNLAKKHVKKSQQHPQGGIHEIERPIHVSNVASCDSNGNIVKVKTQFNEQNERELYFDTNGEKVVVRSLKRYKR
jgi:large subunit ribosomal protein L24